MEGMEGMVSIDACVSRAEHLSFSKDMNLWQSTKYMLCGNGW